MKKIPVLLLSIAMLATISAKAVAGEKLTVKLTGIMQHNQTVLFTLIGDRQFTDNQVKYYLYIGDRLFTEYQISKSNNLYGRMVFSIPADDFNALPGGAPIFLTFGILAAKGQTAADMYKANQSRCWPVGNLDKALLKK